MPRLSVHHLRVVFALATIAIATFIAYQSTRPAGDPTVPVLRSGLSYAGHFGVYAALAFFAMTAAWRRELRTVVAVVFACSAFGLALEVYQGSIEGRESTAMDAVANVLGALLGASVAFVVLPWLRRLAVEHS